MKSKRLSLVHVGRVGRDLGIFTWKANNCTTQGRNRIKLEAWFTFKLEVGNNFGLWERRGRLRTARDLGVINITLQTVSEPFNVENERNRHFSLYQNEGQLLCLAEPPHLSCYVKGPPNQEDHDEREDEDFVFSVYQFQSHLPVIKWNHN